MAPTKASVRRDRLELFGFGAFFVLAMLGVGLLGAVMGQRESRIRAVPLLITELTLLAVVVPAVCKLLARRGRRLRDLDLFVPPEGLWRTLFVGAVLGIAIKLASVVVSLFALPLGVGSGGPQISMHGPLDLLTFVLAGSVAAAIEELVFRGYFTDRVARACRWPRLSWSTGAVTSVLFCLGHGYQGAVGLIVSLFVGLALFGILRSGRFHLAHCIAAHATFNAIAFSLASGLH